MALFLVCCTKGQHTVDNNHGHSVPDSNSRFATDAFWPDLAWAESDSQAIDFDQTVSLLQYAFFARCAVIHITCRKF